jgi:hypothetical protein
MDNADVSMQEIEIPANSSREMFALYKHVNTALAKIDDRNKCQDNAIGSLGDKIGLMTERIDLVLARIDTDREGREASLVIAVKTGMNEIRKDAQENNDERFERQSLEIKTQLNLLQGTIENLQIELQKREIEIAGRPTRKEFDDYVEETNKKIDDHIEGRRWNIGVLVSVIAVLIAGVAAWLSIPRIHS